MKYTTGIMAVCLLGLSSAFGEALPNIELSAAKDTFGRSNNRNGNSGASEFMLLAAMPGVKSLVGFDLAGVTNEITGAEFSFRIHETSGNPLSLIIAPMVHNEKNAKWEEGNGNLGVRGQNAQIGEATFQWRAFRDRPWKDAGGKSVINLMDSGLWKSPTAALKSVEWTEGEWITFKVQDVAMLEEVRKSGFPVATFGLWGTAGDGAYKVSSKESGHPARLVLTVKEDVEETGKQP